MLSLQNKNTKTIAVFLFILASLIVVWLVNIQSAKLTKIVSNAEISYIPIGDSYTIGNGVGEEERWPNVLTRNLQKKGISISIPINPSVSGYTVRDAIDYELKQIEGTKVDFVTVFIGANDSFMQNDVETYKSDLRQLLDKLQKIVSSPKNIILVTIPDYTKSPALQGYEEKETLKKIEDFNEAIKKEAEERELKVADIFPVSQTMTEDDDYISDGLHPSAKGYLKWERIILPIALDLLKN